MTTLTSTRVSNVFTRPQVIAARATQSKMEVVKDTVTVAVGDLDAADIIHLCELPWNAKVHRIEILNDDLDANGAPTLTVNVGLYKVDGAGTVTVVDVDAYASEITTLQALNHGGSNVAFEARGLDKIGNTVFQDGSLTAPVEGHAAVLSLTVVGAAATAAPGKISFVVEYTH